LDIDFDQFGHFFELGKFSCRRRATLHSAAPQRNKSAVLRRRVRNRGFVDSSAVGASGSPNFSRGSERRINGTGCRRRQRDVPIKASAATSSFADPPIASANFWRLQPVVIFGWWVAFPMAMLLCWQVPTGQQAGLGGEVAGL